jgi:ABC-type nitrate/sulfonate/bicarbonate transport system substrate-binding protein
MATADKKTNLPDSPFFKGGLLFLLNLIIAGPILLEHAAAQERVRMALSVRNVVFLPFYYAKDTKIFDRHRLNVELIQMRSDL